MSGWWSKPAERLRLLGTLRSPADVDGFARALCFAALVPLRLRGSTLTLDRWLEPRPRSLRAGAADIEAVVRRVETALAFGRPLVRPGCLTRGLTLYRFLREAGADVELCFGMGLIDGEHYGHCWLVRSGEPFLERADPRLTFAEVWRVATNR